jgi:hypothetical protein
VNFTFVLQAERQPFADALANLCAGRAWNVSRGTWTRVTQADRAGEPAPELAPAPASRRPPPPLNGPTELTVRDEKVKFTRLTQHSQVNPAV